MNKLARTAALSIAAFASAASLLQGATVLTAEAAPVNHTTHEQQASITAYPVSKVLTITRDAQDTGYWCGPAAVKAALSARGVARTQSWLAGQLGTTTNGTNSVADTTRVLNNVLGTGWYENKWIPGNAATASEIARLKYDIVLDTNNNYPIVANVVGTAYDTAGYGHTYSGGHYLTVVGYYNNGDTARIYDVANDTFYNMTTTKLAHWIGLRGYSA